MTQPAHTEDAARAERMAGIREFLAEIWTDEGTLEERRAMMDDATKGVPLPAGVSASPVTIGATVRGTVPSHST